MMSAIFWALSALKSLLPLYMFLFVWAGLTYAFPHPFFGYNSDEWFEFLFLLSPAITWAVVALLDAVGLFEWDNKGGRVN